MVVHGLRAIRDEPRPAAAPVRVWRDRVLVVAVVAGSIVELLLREDPLRSTLPLVVSLVIGLSLLRRRTRPLAAVTVAFGTLLAFDVARIVALDVAGLATIAAVLVLPYALVRWGSGREVTAGLGIVAVWLAVTHLAQPTTVAEVVAGYGFFAFAAALGAAVRFHATTRLRDLEQARLLQRHELARDLHDTVGHHLSGIAVQAQAGRALAVSRPDRALEVLTTIEEAAARALEEMRALVGVLRDRAEPELAPRPGVADIARLARPTDVPRIDVHLTGPLHDLPPPVEVALYRIAQEAVTNARHHARSPSRVVVELTGDRDGIRLTVRDDGGPVTAPHAPAGFGLAGMRERASLLGGAVHAGPAPDGGWTVDATLPTPPTSASDPGLTRGSASP